MIKEVISRQLKKPPLKMYKVGENEDAGNYTHLSAKNKPNNKKTEKQDRQNTIGEEELQCHLINTNYYYCWEELDTKELSVP